MVVEKEHKKQRLFVALELPENVIDYLSELQKILRNDDIFQARFVKPEHIHVTLTFLGDIAYQDIELIKQTLKTISLKSFKVCLDSFGSFPNFKRPSILWVGLKGKELSLLANEIHGALSAFLPRENSDFVAHATLARIKNIKNSDQLFSLLETLEIENRCFDVKDFVLKQSILSPEGPEHVEVARFALNN